MSLRTALIAAAVALGVAGPAPSHADEPAAPAGPAAPAVDSEIVRLVNQLEETRAASDALKQLTRRPAEAMPVVAERLSDPRVSGGLCALIDAWQGVSVDLAPLVPALARHLASLYPNTRSTAMRVLGAWVTRGNGDVSLLAAMLRAATEPNERSMVLQAIEKRGLAAGAAAPDVRAAMKDRVDFVRAAAAKALAAITTPGDPEVEGLFERLERANTADRWQASLVLGALRPVHSDVVERLVEAAQTTDDDKRRSAVHALAGCAKDSRTALEALATLLRADSADVRLSAAGVCADLGAACAPILRALAGALVDPDPRVTEAASKAVAACADRIDDAVAEQVVDAALTGRGLGYLLSPKAAALAPALLDRLASDVEHRPLALSLLRQVPIDTLARHAGRVVDRVGPIVLAPDTPWFMNEAAIVLVARVSIRGGDGASAADGLLRRFARSSIRAPEPQGADGRRLPGHTVLDSALRRERVPPEWRERFVLSVADDPALAKDDYQTVTTLIAWGATDEARREVSLRLLRSTSPAVAQAAAAMLTTTLGGPLALVDRAISTDLDTERLAALGALATNSTGLTTDHHAALRALAQSGSSHAIRLAAAVALFNSWQPSTNPPLSARVSDEDRRLVGAVFAADLAQNGPTMFSIGRLQVLGASASVAILTLEELLLSDEPRVRNEARAALKAIRADEAKTRGDR